jgi:hypothetical protein
LHKVYAKSLSAPMKKPTNHQPFRAIRAHRLMLLVLSRSGLGPEALHPRRPNSTVILFIQLRAF